MTTKVIVLTIVLFSLIVIGMFIFANLHPSEQVDQNIEDEKQYGQ